MHHFAVRTVQVALLVLLFVALSSRARAMDGSDEFVGPFPSWLNIKSDFGAIGDGKADDTAAIQKALDALRPADAKRKVLYFPAGTYRITQRLELLRAEHAQSMGLSIIGEDPATTIIKWDGPADGVMFYCNYWYSRTERVTFDGSGKALTAIWHGKPFATAMQYADMVFKDLGYGIRAGGEQAGIAETTVLRCSFLRCAKAGVSIEDWNTLDWFIRQCRFEDCGIGVTNDPGSGNFHVFESLFKNSAISDIKVGNLSYFSFRYNTSIGSKMFFHAGPFASSCPFTLQGNTIIEPQSLPAVVIGNHGPTLVLDNVFKLKPDVKTGPVVQSDAQMGDLLAVGNTYSAADPIKFAGRLITIDEKPAVAAESIQVTVPELPATPVNRHREIFKVQSGAKAEEIQAVIDQAAKLLRQRPVVHLPAGKYSIDKTLVIPAGSDLQLVGDGIYNSTVLEWSGGGAGPVLRLAGPSRATARELSVNGSQRAEGIVIDNFDQPQARIHMQGSSVGGTQGTGFFVEGIDNADVTLHGCGHSGAKVGVKVTGGPKSQKGDATTGRVVFFGGASSNNELSYDVDAGAKLMARDIWYEGSPRGFLHLKGNGTFTFHGAVVAVGHNQPPPTDEERKTPAMWIDNAKGKITILGTHMLSVMPELPAKVRVSGGGPETNALFLGDSLEFTFAFENQASPQAHVAWALNQKRLKDQNSERGPHDEKTDPAWIKRMLEQTRTQAPHPLTDLPEGVTDVRLFRVEVDNGTVGIHLKQ